MADTISDKTAGTLLNIANDEGGNDEYQRAALEVLEAHGYEVDEISTYVFVDDEADEPDMPFEEYLRENIFTFGGYVYEERAGDMVAVSEHVGGGGFICAKDARRVVEDDNVGAIGTFDSGTGHDLEGGGYLTVTDQR